VTDNRRVIVSGDPGVGTAIGNTFTVNYHRRPSASEWDTYLCQLIPVMFPARGAEFADRSIVTGDRVQHAVVVVLVEAEVDPDPVAEAQQQLQLGVIR
jgi:hypothetical protein